MAFASQHLHPRGGKRRVIWNEDNGEGICEKAKAKAK